MNNEEQNTIHSDTPDENRYNTLQAVEQVYPAESIDHVELVNNLSDSLTQMTFDAQQPAANEAFAHTDVYSLDNTRLSKHHRCLERRAHKDQLTDRRSSSRLSADGEIQQDRRKGNRVANMESIRLSSDHKSDVA